MLRVLLVAPNDGCSNVYLRRAFEAEGNLVKEFDYRQPVMGVYHPVQKALDFDPTLVVVLKGESLPVDALKDLRDAGAKVVVWNFDPRDGHAAWVLERARAADVFFTIAKGLVPFYEDEGINAHWLLEAADPEIHRPVEGAVEQFLVSFAGTVDGVPGRFTWLERVAAALTVDSLHLWGSFPKVPTRAVYHGRAEGDSGLNFVTSSSVVVLGRDRNPEIERSYGARLFRTLAAGGFLLTNATTGIKRDFAGAVGVYEDDEDCVRVLPYWLGETAERRRVAERGRKLVLAEHTWRHRVREMVRVVGV